MGPERRSGRPPPALPSPSPTSASSRVEREVEVERLEQMAEPLRLAAGRWGEEPQHADRLTLVAALAAQRGEPQQAERGRGVAGGDRVIADLLAAGDQLVPGRRRW